MKSELSFTHRFLRGKSRTTLLLLHGTGGDENDMVSLGRAISPESSILSPRGKALESGMPRFFRRIREGVFDVADLKFRSVELSDFVREASVKYTFDPGSVVAVGYSNGANIAASILLLRLLSLAGAVLFRPMVPFIPDSLPSLNGIPVFISAGANDPIVPRAETTKLVDLLSRARAEVALSRQPAGHGITEAEVRIAKAWFASHFPTPQFGSSVGE